VAVSRLGARAPNDVIWDWNLVTGEVLWNEAASTLFRRPAHEIVPTSQWWYGNIHPADRQRVVSGIRRVIDQAGEQWTDEYRVLRGDGTYATVLDRGHVAHDARGVSVRMIGSMLDLTERKRAEEHQRLVAEATSTLSDALDPRAALHAFARLAVPRVADVCAVFVPDDDTRRMIPLVVVASEGIDGDRVHAALRATPRDVSDPRDVMARCIRSGMGTLCGVTRDEGADVLAALGTESAVVAPIQANGRTFGAVVLGRRQAPVFAAAELTTIQDLVLRVALAVDHARLYDNAVLANRAKSDFLAVMSHELRTPLNAVVGYADLLLLGIPGPLTAESQQYVSRVLACAKHLLQLIEQILSFSRIEAGREEVRTERVELPALARETAAIVEPRAREKGLRFELAIDAPPTAVLETDVDKVREILLNLLSNAVKFTERGTVRLDVRLAPGTAEFEVRDSGIGIPVRHIDHIFDPFWQVEQRKTRTAGGTGLGLSVSRRLAQLLGGELAVVSREGEGSRFTLRLPVGR
jgi:signal transduction histidine kinase